MGIGAGNTRGRQGLLCLKPSTAQAVADGRGSLFSYPQNSRS